jgi:hypothetical protein
MKQKGFFFSGILLGSLLLFSIISCRNANVWKVNKKQNVLVDTATFKPGVIYEKVKCLGHPGESYALTLPRNYVATKKFPVVFFFDAQERGWLPVKRYQPLADSFGFILVASDNSKNGQNAQERNRIIYNFMLDVEQRFSVDPDRIYTGGFSGGARIAAGIGLANKNIAGTIGCAAGFPQLNHIVNNRLVYVGIVGNKDFNYLEMKSLNRELEANRWHHCLLIFNGHHQWPPLQTMKKAFGFMQTDAMRRQLIPVNKTEIASLKKSFEKQRTVAVRNNNPLLQMQTDRQLVAFLNGLTDVSVYENEIRHLMNNPVLKQQQQQQVVLKKEEQKWQHIYVRALESRDSGWWKNALGNLAYMMKSAKTQEEKHMVRRLYNYLSLMSYLYADGSLKNNQTTIAGKYLMIYQTVDPKNPEVYFLKAQRFAMTGETKAILPSLQKAANNGFYDVKRMENNPYFAGLQQNPAFRKILFQVKENKKVAKE